MSCGLLRDMTLGCADSQGGVEKIYVTELANVTGTASDASGEITGVTLASGKRFFIYNVEMGVSQATEQGTRSRENGTSYYEQSINSAINEITKGRRLELNNLQQNLLLVIAKDKNGLYRLFGRVNGMICNVLTDTGLAMGDRNGYTLAFTGQEAAPAPVVATSLITTITTA
jgi:hypothetical protein